MFSFTYLTFVSSEEGSELKVSPMTVNSSTGSDRFSVQETEEREEDVLNYRVFHLYLFCIQLYSLSVRNRARLVFY